MKRQRMRTPVRSLFCLWIFLRGMTVALLLVQPVYATTASDLEYRVKAAFLFNFTKFVDWPATAFADSSAALNICVLGRDPFGSTLDETIKGKQVNNRTLGLRRISQVSESQGCNILFISDSEHPRLRDITQAVQDQPILTIGESPDFTDARGMIRFLIVDGKVRFVVNRSATDQAHLVMSSKLLSVAQNVVEGTGQ